MDIWIIRNGKKIGPIHDFEVRRKINDGELTPDTPSWHEGLGAWRPLGEIDLFRREFELTSNEAASKTIENEPGAAASEPTPPDSNPSSDPDLNRDPKSANLAPPPPPLPAKAVYGRRFWARWFDLSLYSGFWWLGMWAAGQNIEAALSNPWIMFAQYIPWFAIEALLIQRFGTTPGKWLLGLQVRNLDNTRLDLNASIRRSVRVLFTGIGFGWGLLAVFCQAMSLVVAKRLGTTLWDHSGGHRVNSTPLQAAKIIALPILFFLVLQMQLIVIVPYMVEIAGKSFPSLKEQYEKNPPWHLPAKTRENR
jgi:uncharacterized RDD family membrane protein YckC